MPTIRVRKPLYDRLKEIGLREGLRPAEVADDLIRHALKDQEKEATA